jgi:hypothetical protein
MYTPPPQLQVTDLEGIKIDASAADADLEEFEKKLLKQKLHFFLVNQLQLPFVCFCFLPLAFCRSANIGDLFCV